MKLTTSAIMLSLLAASTQAWELTVWMKDGRHVTTNGNRDSGCKTYSFNMNSPVNKVVFEKSIFAGTFELYTGKDCGGDLSYKRGDGSFTLTPARKIQSYKVY